MPDQQVVLADVEWQQLLAIVCNAQGPGINWAVVNPLVMKLGEQLRVRTEANVPAYQQVRPNGPLPATEEEFVAEPPHRRVPRTS